MSVQPEDAILLHEVFARTARRLPAKVALACGAERFTYADLDARAWTLAQALAARGVARGDRVVLFLDNGVELVAGMLAALRLGAIFVPVNALTKREKLEYMLNDTRAAAMVTHRALATAWREALAANATVHTCFVAGPEGEMPARCLRYPAAETAAARLDPGTIDQDLASIIYTSGSTGDPKGVMLTHLNLVSSEL